MARRRAKGSVRIEQVPVDELVGWPGNPKEHDVLGIRDSIARHGFVVPAVVDERTGRLVAGHGRAEALRTMRRLGDDPPRRVTVLRGGGWAMPVLRGVAFATEAEAEAYLVADNRLTVLGGFREDLLTAMLARVASRSLEGVGFEAAQVEERVAEAAQRVNVRAHERAPAAPATATCPGCGHTFERRT